MSLKELKELGRALFRARRPNTLISRTDFQRGASPSFLLFKDTRRQFLSALRIAGLLQSGLRPALETPRQIPGLGGSAVSAKKGQKPFHILSEAQLEILQAIAGQIIPKDADPGANEAGVARYIERALAGEQSDKLPLYLLGLGGIDETSQVMFATGFVHLSSEGQLRVLKDLQEGRAVGKAWRSLPSQEFFAMVWRHVFEGFYGPPEEGGNKNYASWKMLAFPEHSGGF